MLQGARVTKRDGRLTLEMLQRGGGRGYEGYALLLLLKIVRLQFAPDRLSRNCSSYIIRELVQKL